MQSVCGPAADKFDRAPSGVLRACCACLELQVIVFSFSKKECEERAAEMQALDLTDADEKKLIESIYHNAMECLSAEDQRLTQVSGGRGEACTGGGGGTSA